MVIRRNQYRPSLFDNNLYDSVKDGRETQRSLEFNSQPDYREKYEKEMQEIRDLEIWRAGKAVR